MKIWFLGLVLWGYIDWALIKASQQTQVPDRCYGVHLYVSEQNGAYERCGRCNKSCSELEQPVVIKSQHALQRTQSLMVLPSCGDAVQYVQQQDYHQERAQSVDEGLKWADWGPEESVQARKELDDFKVFIETCKKTVGLIPKKFTPKTSTQTPIYAEVKEGAVEKFDPLGAKIAKTTDNLHGPKSPIVIPSHIRKSRLKHLEHINERIDTLENEYKDIEKEVQMIHDTPLYQDNLVEGCIVNVGIIQRRKIQHLKALNKKQLSCIDALKVWYFLKKFVLEE